MNDFAFANYIENILSSSSKSLDKKQIDNIVNNINCFLPHFAKIYLSKLRYHKIISGRGGAKTSQIGRIIIKESFNPELKNTNFACGREFAKNLDETSYSTISLLIDDMGFNDYFKFIPSKKRIKNKINGTTLYFMGCQNPNHFTSIPNLSRIWLDEIENIERYAIERIFKSVRGSITNTTKYNTKIYCTYNPLRQLDPITSYLNERINGGMGSSVHMNMFDLPKEWQDKDLMAEAIIDKANDIDLYNWIWLGYPRPDIQENIFENVIYNELPQLPTQPVIAFMDPSFAGGDTTAISLLWIKNNKFNITGYCFKKAWYECDNEVLELFKNFNIQEFYYESNMLENSVSNHYYTNHGKMLIPHKNTKNKVNRIYKIGYFLNKMDFVKPFPLSFVDSSGKMWQTQITKYNRLISTKPKKDEHDDAPDSLASIFEIKKW